MVQVAESAWLLASCCFSGTGSIPLWDRHWSSVYFINAHYNRCHAMGPSLFLFSMFIHPFSTTFRCPQTHKGGGWILSQLLFLYQIIYPYYSPVCHVLDTVSWTWDWVKPERSIATPDPRPSYVFNLICFLSSSGVWYCAFRGFLIKPLLVLNQCKGFTNLVIDSRYVFKHGKSA